MNGRELASALTAIINQSGHRELDAFVDELLHLTHPTLQQSLFRNVLWPLIKGFSEKFAEGSYDLRNEVTTKECARMATAVLTANDGQDPHIPFV